MSDQPVHETWSSRRAFLLAAIGAAVGLGNIWRFPYLAGESGGAAFVLVYLLCVAVIGVPVLLTELSLGRRGGLSPVGTMGGLAAEEGRSRHWRKAGWAQVITIFLAGSFYYVVASWVLAYVLLAAEGAFNGIDRPAAATMFDSLMASPWRMALWYGFFIGLTVAVVASGIRHGLERAVKLMMPALFVLLVVLVGYAAWVGDFAAGAGFLFRFDASKVTGGVVLAAMGQAFFTLGVGQAVMITYGAYIPKNINLISASAIIALADLAVALLAALVIFPLVFANGMAPDAGPSLVFKTLPIVFGAMPAGGLFGTLFFLLIAIAALTSTISGVEPIVSWAEEHKGWRRPVVATVAGLALWLVGLASVFSFNLLADFHPLGFVPGFGQATVFNLLEYASVNLLMPLNALLLTIFAGWLMARKSLLGALEIGDGRGFRLLYPVIRYIVPLAIMAIFIANILPAG